jgi:antibiotic biosynthesis monooxygenase (ABM) superfamily enzyme
MMWIMSPPLSAFSFDDMPVDHPIHVAITRKIKPGREEEFHSALRDFFKNSFAYPGMHGASLLVPPPGSTSREYGIIRTFANEGERDAFYASPFFQEWKKRIAPVTEGEPEYRQLHGLEAWFRNANLPNPPQWKMAVLTFIGVWPVSMAAPALLGPLIGNKLPNVIFAGAVAASIVLALTWVVMPVLVRLAKQWLS